MFKKISFVDKLEEKHKKIPEEANNLTIINRKMSDAKISEANDLLQEINRIKNNS